MALHRNKAGRAHDKDALSRMTGLGRPRLNAHDRDARAIKVF